MVNLSEEEWLTFDDVLLKPKLSDIATRQAIDTSTIIGKQIFTVPIMSANMDYVTEYNMAKAMWESGGFYALHRFYNEWEDWENDIVSLYKSEMPISFSVGIRDIKREVSKVDAVDDYCTIAAINNTNIPVFAFIDVAHGHHRKVFDLIRRIKDINPDITVVAGNIATWAAFYDLAEAGADVVKVGIGPGAVCTTRSVAGVGVPQFSAIVDVARARDSYRRDVKIIADGGFRTSGDIVKALAAGADMVMLGYLLAGSEETPAPSILLGDKMHKKYRGQSTIGINLSRETPEGVEGYVPVTGPASVTVSRLAAGIRSGFSYVGARTLDELRLKAEFVRVSPHTIVENQTRVVLG